ncbi:Crp/Fnr family transcriptional regulator [Pontibacter sp. SGAir0037]|uniref:Crp/Fnr family transcriptional regulator n=1 Tax=Pontibacter sp. SGAir0037 TaxID=2571030 RepID=UPI0010CCB870|nr:Crp/Fnr family transcriptional regulator [Pontibacter sp. SGAir0037]QCR24216.1 Crp/Fnr family transcriptional regulator [Pontibacter sp. SGAir0037]
MLHTLLQQISYFTPEDIAAFLPLWKKQVHLNRYDYLIRQGQVEQGLYFVASGALRIYYPTQEEDICVGFGYPNTLIVSFPSFVDNKPSAYYIQALKKSELLGINKADFVQLMAERPNVKAFWYRELERALVGKIEREVDLLLPEPEKRLERVMQRSPHLFQHIPKKYIASYLRMSPETLSRLR